MMEQRRQEACDEVDEIRIDGGGVTPDDLEYLERKRPRLLRSVRNLQKKLAGSAKLLAEQLNTKDTRFVYELIQNADDNRYPDGVEPFLDFTLQEEYLKIESNEVGFKPENIEAISSVGQSTKGSKIGFIGEKGIGFKSVFRIARKAHIQSEPYSFAFIYDDDDSGLGMVTPLNEPYLPIRDGVQTQMILHFRDRRNREQVLEEFLHHLPLTILLFLKKLKRITLDINVPEHASRLISYSVLPTDGSRTKNRVTIRKDDGDSSSDYDFWVKKKRVYDMPPHSARVNISQAEVVLAFPLLEEVPVIESQWISAYLPMRKETFKFLIQSDFITGANREDIQQCEWNDQLRRAISSAFVRAAQGKHGFLSHPTLRYSWVRYIPTDSIGHDYWGELQKSIIKKLKTQKMFLSQQENCNGHSQDNDDREAEWWLPEQLRIVTQEYRDEEDEPLLQDLTQGKTAYISERYDHTLDLPILRKLGALDLRLAPDFIDRLSQDIDREDDSDWRSPEFSSPWRTTMSNLLLKSIKDPAQKGMIQRMEMVPLQTSKWVRSLNASLFFPTSDGIDIPSDLSLSLVDNEALENTILEALLIGLGVSKCRPEQVIPLIEQRYVAGARLSPITMTRHMKFLFWHNVKVPTTEYKIYLSCNEGKRNSWSDVATGSWVYCPEVDHPYSMFRLLGSKIPSELENKIRFPRYEYFEALGQLGLRNRISGRDWLMSRAGIMITPRLRHRDELKMSAELLYICGKLPQYLLGVLQNDWTNYNKSRTWDKVIRSTKVPILDAQKERELETTFLPLPSLRKIAAELDLSQEFCFLAELGQMTEVESVKWSFLERFGVGIKEDLGFWLALLQRLKQKKNIKREYVFRIYRQLQKFTSEEEVEVLRKVFDRQKLLYIPESKSSVTWQWNYLFCCIWKAPDWFLSSTALESLDDYKQLYGLFVNSLQVHNLAISDCLTMLEEIKAGCYGDDEEQETNTYRLYTKLNELVESEKDGNAAKDQIREYMEDCKLVYQKVKGSWHPPTGCIWAEDHIQLPGKFSLATAYEGHATFFLHVLKIPKPDLAMHIASLIEKSTDSQDKKTILLEMLNICALNPNVETLQAKLMDCRCFPVRKRSGKIEWLESTRRFAIVDRADYAGMFRDKVNTLEFTLEEVHSLKVFLLGMNLEKRYLSNAATEETEVEEAMADSLLTTDLRSKAYAITRYAAHLGAPEPLKIFSLLENLEVFSSDKIFRTVSVFQKQHKDNAFFHIEKIGDQLKMYVPRNQEQQQVCLFRQLPSKLLVQLGVGVQGKGTELSAIITASSLVVVDTILEQDGVIEILGVTKPENSMTRSPPVPTTFTDSAAASTDSLATPVDSVSETSSMRSSSEPEMIYHAENANHASNGAPWTPPGRDSHAPHEAVEPVEQPELFQKLIDFAVHQANHIGALPNLGSYVEASQAFEDSFDHRLAVQSSPPMNVTNRIGAIGELFVYTVLQNLGLTSFDESCWISRIRHLIAVNNQYSEIITPLTETEITDLVYSDREGELTALLIQAGYLARSSWRGCTPRYHIEVKTTMGSMNYQLFCSQSQFERMESMELSDGEEDADDIYLIARVFGLGRARMGMKLYLDPWKLRRTKQLKFFASVYQVTPL